MRALTGCISVLGLVLSAIVGCAHDGYRGLSATSEPVRVEVQNKSYDYVATESVGSATHRNAAGAVVGTTDITRNVVRTQRYKDWAFFQGKQQIDELDFFSIAGDDNAAAVLRQNRRKGMLSNRIGLGLVALGIVGAGLMSASDPTVRRTGVYLMFGLPIGGIMAYWGKGVVEDEHHHSLERARRASAAAAAAHRARATRTQRTGQ